MSDTLLAKLEAWATERRILPSCFKCQYYKECNASHGNLKGGDSVAMSYVGPRYEQPVDQLDLRLVLVGIDHASGSHDFRERREITLRFERRPEGFNQDYQGVVRTAAAIFGRHTSCAECATAKRCHLPQRPGTSCVLEMIARPNLVKCAHGPNMTSRSTPVMMGNCVKLLLEELELLRPTLVVFHGADAKAYFEPAVRARGWTHCPVSGDGTGALFEIVGPTLRADVLYAHHAARSRLARQWACVVEPALALLRERGKIPV